MFHPDLAFFSEPQTFQADVNQCMDYFRGEYSFSLNSEDLHEPDLAFQKTRTKGGTMIMWRHSLDPYVTVFPVQTASFLPIHLHIPGFLHSIHIALYLPTAGKEAEFLLEMSRLKFFIDQAIVEYPNTSIFVPGDADSSRTS